MSSRSFRSWSSVWCAAVAVVVAVVGVASDADARDTVSHPYPGITHTHRSLSSPRKEIHILEADLTRPEIKIRATTSAERGKTPSQFSSLVGAAAVINGDFFNTNGSYDPSGLAIGRGTRWNDIRYPRRRDQGS